VTAHDGFTLNDLVSYEQKHNEANGEGNRDGESHNESMNFGVEGPTDDPAIRAAREQQKRNILATLLLSQGVPMILSGDELGRTQQGNNNAYCQDNEISWLDWDLGDDGRALLEFTRQVVRIFHNHPVFRRRRFFQGRRIRNSGLKDLTWYGPHGDEMTDELWDASGLQTIGLRMAGDAIEERGPRGERIVDDTLLLILNAEAKQHDFRLPRGRGTWRLVFDTARSKPPARSTSIRGTYRLAGRSTVLLRIPRR
jgi:glycogen operon protein